LNSNLRFTVSATFLSLLVLASAFACFAQATLPLDDERVLGTSDVSSTAAPVPAITDQPLAAAPAAPIPAQVGMKADDDGWHFSVSPYLWLPGVHGTLGVRNQSASIHASPGDLLSHFRFGLMGAVEPRYKRFVMPFDMMWIRLQDNKGVPNLGDVTDRSVTVKGSEFLLTQKFGYRVINSEMIKADALAGFRYWHFGQNLIFNPSGINFSKSQNWVDPLVGGRVQVFLSPKIVVDALGDVGGWGAGSQLDYQFAALLGYRIKPKWTLQAGFRYLFINYTNGTSFVDLVTSGVIFGVTYTIK
jgi:hypothetical protein